MEGLPDKIRAFVAVRLAAQVESEIGAFVETLRRLNADISWVGRDRFHVTLRFLGDEFSAQAIPQLSDALARVAAAGAPFEVEARGAGAFPNLERPRVIWIALPSVQLTQLGERVEAAAVDCGLERERRPYSPHLTIGRVRNSRGLSAVRSALLAAADRDFGSSRIETLTLYRSILGNGPATYTELARFPLG